MKRRSLLSLLALILCLSVLLTIGVAAAPASYGLTVGGVQVTADNKDDVFGDGTVSYDSVKDVLYLDGAKITNNSGAAISTASDLTIYFDGRNTLKGATDGIVCGDLELSGDDKAALLYIDAEFYGIDSTGDIYIEYANVDIYTSGRRNAGAIYTSRGEIELEDCKITYPTSARITTDKTTSECYVGKSGVICADVEIEVKASSSSSSSKPGGSVSINKPSWGNNWGSSYWDDCDCTYWDNCDCSYWCDCDCSYCDCDYDWYDDCDCTYWDNCDCSYWCDCDCKYCDCDDDYWYDCDCKPWESCYYCSEDRYDIWKPSRWYDDDTSIKNHPYFSDISKYDTFYEDVIYVYNKGLMNGVGENKFDPYGTATRGMIVTVLHRMEREPNVNAGLSFSDVPANAYYTKAVKWAVANEIVIGYDNGTFGPDDTITREQLISILYRYAKSEGYKVSSASSLSSFEDAGKVSEYAVPAYKWANAKDYLTGYSLQPQAAAPRWMIAQLLHNFMLDY